MTSSLLHPKNNNKYEWSISAGKIIRILKQLVVVKLLLEEKSEEKKKKKKKNKQKLQPREGTEGNK